MVSLPLVFLIFCSAGVIGRKSATAAEAINNVAPDTTLSTASSISLAEITLMRLTLSGVGKSTGPAIKVTLAPASTAACAKAKPILPVEKLLT